jgi:hypothetical protein
MSGAAVGCGVFPTGHATQGDQMDAKEQVLKAMKSASEPLNAGKVAEISGLDRKVVDKAMADLKKSGEIVSPKRCYWQPS